ncbi:MAG: efflux RND transporter periplasmic adaptor subunit, partial [Acidobacteria bacterium]|nr:efflux RND transporter periplasmic adaptor subunit [Acidobacteriota bacterium]
MMVKTRSAEFISVIGVSLALAGCGGRPATSRSLTARDGTASPVATVVTVRVELGRVEESLETFGTVEFDPHETRTVSFVKSGQVAQMLVTPGQSIAKGDPLLELGPLPSS